MADPVPLDIELYLEEKVREYDATFELREGSSFRDFFIKPLSAVIQPLRNDLETVRVLQSIVNFEQMTDDEFDTLVANYFITRRSGNKSTGTGRLYFSTPRATTITKGSVVLSAQGLRFLVDEDTSITSSAMSVNVDGSLYYMDLPLTAESAGEEFNIARGTLVSLESTVAGVVRVSNNAAFTGGIATESNFELFNRAQSAITVRNLINDRSIVTTLLEQFDFIKAIVPIGFNDPEMLRDLETIVLPGPPQHPVDIHMGGMSDIYTEVSSLDTASVTVQQVPASLVVDTNTDRGAVTALDYGLRRIAVKGGYFRGVFYPGDPAIDLLAFRYYTLSLTLNTASNQYELTLDHDAVSYPAASGTVLIARVRTDGAEVIEILDDRSNLFSFSRPMISLDSVEVLDSVSLQPTGVELRDGLTALIAPSIVSDPGSIPHMAMSRGSGDIHFVFKKSTGVYYTRLDAGANPVVTDVQISSDVNAKNLRISPTLQEDLNIFFLDFSGNIRHIKVDHDGTGVLVPEHTVSGAGTTIEFELSTDPRGAANILSINTALGQPDVYFIQVSSAGAVSTAQTLVQTTLSNASGPSLDPQQNWAQLSNAATTGVTDGTNPFTDANANFVVDGVVAGDDLVIYSGDAPIPLSELGVYEIQTVGATSLTLLGSPAITASTGVVYEILKGDGGLICAWEDDDAGTKNIRMTAIGQSGVIVAQFAGQHIVVSDPTSGTDKTLASVVKDNLPPIGTTILWVDNDTEIEVLQFDNLALVAASTTGDTQASGTSRSFLDASNPFLPSDVGAYLGISSGSGLAPEDCRLYRILEVVSPGHVLLDVPITESTAADIAYLVTRLSVPRKQLAPGFFQGRITSMTADLDDSNGTHVAVISTDANSGTAYLGKFSDGMLPLIGTQFIRVKSSDNNQSSISLFIDSSRQPAIAWDDFSATYSQVHFSKYQAQEFAFVVNDLGKRMSIQEDNSIILDPVLANLALRFNFTWASLVGTVDQFINDTVNRVVIGNYLAKHTFPAFVDIDLVYSGADAPTEADALTLVTDFINAVGSTVEPPTISSVVSRSTVGEVLEVSDLVDVLYNAGADSVRIGSELLVAEAQPAGFFREHRSIDKVTITRTAKYVARNVTVRLET